MDRSTCESERSCSTRRKPPPTCAKAPRWPQATLCTSQLQTRTETLAPSSSVITLDTALPSSPRDVDSPSRIAAQGSPWRRVTPIALLVARDHSEQTPRMTRMQIELRLMFRVAAPKPYHHPRHGYERRRALHGLWSHGYVTHDSLHVANVDICSFAAPRVQVATCNHKDMSRCSCEPFQNAKGESCDVALTLSLTEQEYA